MASRSPAVSSPVLRAVPADPVAAAVAAVNVVLVSPPFAEAMHAALSRKPARNAHDLLKLSRQVLAKQFSADMTGVGLTVTWEPQYRISAGERGANVVRAVPALTQPTQVAHG